MGLFTKQIKMPSGQKVEVTAYEMWEVRWNSVRRSDLGNPTPQLESFTNEEDARRFAQELLTAASLLRDRTDSYRDSDDWRPRVTKNEFKGV